MMAASIRNAGSVDAWFVPEVNTAPKWSVRNLSYGEMGKLQEVVRCLRHHGAKVNAVLRAACACGRFQSHTKKPQKCYDHYVFQRGYPVQGIEGTDIKRTGVLPESTPHCAGEDPPDAKQHHFHGKVETDMVWRAGMEAMIIMTSTRYYALNLHAVFSKGTLEWRCFESTLHAGKVRANITLALAISAQAINQKCTQMRKTEITENPAFTFRTFLLRLGLIGPEYKNVREHLLANWKGIGRGDMTAVSMNV